jgi:hypothetical protein
MSRFFQFAVLSIAFVLCLNNDANAFRRRHCAACYGTCLQVERSTAVAANAPHGQWGAWGGLPFQAGKLSTANFVPYNPKINVDGEIKFVNMQNQPVTLPFVNKQVGFQTNSQPQVRFIGRNGATTVNVSAVP